MASQDFMQRILKGVQSVVSHEGFVMRRNAFIRECNDVLLLIHIQRSSNTTKDKLIVTVNLGIFSKPLSEIYGNTVNIWSCHWNLRIGHLLPDCRDKWWKATNTTEADEATAEIQRLIQDIAIPELAKRDSTSKLVASWEAGEYGGLTEEQRKRYIKAIKGIV